MKKIKITLFLLISITGYAFTADKIRISIMDLKAIGGVSEALAQNVSSILRNEIGATQRFVIVDVSSLSAVQAEQARQHSGCTDSACAVKLGNMLNVQKIVVGTIGTVGGVFDIRISFIDVELGQMELSEKVSAKKEADILNAAEFLSKRIAARIGIQGKILTVLDADTFVINIGANDGVQKGDTLTIVRMGEALTDEETGEFYGRLQKKIGMVQIIEFQGPQLAQVKTMDKLDGKAEKGDRVVMEGKNIPMPSVFSATGTGSGKPGKAYSEAVLLEINGENAVIDKGLDSKVKKRMLYEISRKDGSSVMGEVKSVEEDEATLVTSRPLEQEWAQNKEVKCIHKGRRKILTIGYTFGMGTSQGQQTVGSLFPISLYLPKVLGLQVNLGSYASVQTVRTLTITESISYPSFVTVNLLSAKNFSPYIGAGFAMRSGYRFDSATQYMQTSSNKPVLAWTAGLSIFRIRFFGMQVSAFGTTSGLIAGQFGISLNIF